MKPSEDLLITPRKSSNDGEITTMFMQNKSNPMSLHKNKKSPFIGIGTKIKSIFGNFFKTSEKLNKSYEDAPLDTEFDGKLKGLMNSNGA
jgi:hypothetical protein